MQNTDQNRNRYYTREIPQEIQNFDERVERYQKVAQLNYYSGQ